MEQQRPDDERDERIAAPDEQQGAVEEVGNDVGDPNASDVDDDQDTDHLARLDDPDTLAKVEEIEAEQGGQHYGDESPGDGPGTD